MEEKNNKKIIWVNCIKINCRKKFSTEPKDFSVALLCDDCKLKEEIHGKS